MGELQRVLEPFLRAIGQIDAAHGKDQQIGWDRG